MAVMIRWAASLIVAPALALASVASAQDAPPPGCRWHGSVLACKDGKGNWRRAGDDEIVGTYAVSKPASRPTPAKAQRPKSVARPGPSTATKPAEAEPVAASSRDVTAVVESPPPPPPAADDVVIAEKPQAAAAPPVEPPAAKPWWRRWLDGIWSDIQALLRLIGLAR